MLCRSRGERKNSRKKWKGSGRSDGPITLGDFGQPHQDGACDHEGQCVLLHIWDRAGEHMRRYLEGYTLAGIAEIARGDAPWP